MKSNVSATDMIDTTSDVISGVVQDVSNLKGFDLPPLDVIVRSKLYSMGVMSKYLNPVTLQEIIIKAQRRLLKDPLKSYDLISVMSYNPIIYDPYITYVVNSDTPISDILGSWDTDLRLDLVQECMNQLIAYEDPEYVVNRVFSGSHVKNVFTSSALWFALKGNQSGDLESESRYDYSEVQYAGISLLANRYGYFFYPGANEDLIAIYEKGLAKAVDILSSEEISQVSDFRACIMYYIYGDVASVFEEYGDNTNYLGIDQIVADLSDRIVDRMSDAMIQCLWDNMEFLVTNSRSNNDMNILLEKVVKAYINLAMCY